MPFRSSICALCGASEATEQCPRCNKPLCGACAEQRGDAAWREYEVAAAQHGKELRASKLRSLRLLLLYLLPGFLLAGFLNWAEPNADKRWLIVSLSLFLGTGIGWWLWWHKNKRHPKPPGPDILSLTPCSRKCQPLAKD